MLLTPSGASPLRQKPQYVENRHPRDLSNFNRASLATSWLAASKSCCSSNSVTRTGLYADVTLNCCSSLFMLAGSIDVLAVLLSDCGFSVMRSSSLLMSHFANRLANFVENSIREDSVSPCTMPLTPRTSSLLHADSVPSHPRFLGALFLVSARESFHRDRRQVPSSPFSLSINSPQGAFHKQSHLLILRILFVSSHKTCCTCAPLLQGFLFSKPGVRPFALLTPERPSSSTFTFVGFSRAEDVLLCMAPSSGSAVPVAHLRFV